MTRRPSLGNIVYGYGMRWHPVRERWQMHYAEDIGWGNGAGLDLVMPQRAQLVDYRDRGDWGLQARLRAGNVEHRLSHTEQLADGVSVGQWLDEGELVAIMGDTGLALGKHVHWEVLVDGLYVDPAGWLASTAAADPVRPFPTPPPSPEEEDEMATTPRQIHCQTPDKKVLRALLVPGTGYFVKWTERDATYANNIAQGFDTGSSTEVTPSLFGVFEREAIAQRPKDALSIELAEVG